MKNKFSISIQNILIFAFISQILVISIIISYISYYNSVISVNAVTNEFIREINYRVYEELKDYFQGAENLIKLNYSLINRDLVHLDNSEKLKKIFIQNVRYNETINSLYFGNKEGGIINAGRESEGDSYYIMYSENLQAGPLFKYEIDDENNTNKLITTIKNFDAVSRPWYKKALETESITWSSPYVLSTGHDMAITVSKPVYKRETDEIEGVLAADLFLSYLDKFMSTLKVGKNGKTIIINKEGELISTSGNKNVILKNDVSKTFEKLNWENSDINFISHIHDYFNENKIFLENINEEFVFSVSAKKSKFNVVVLPFKKFDSMKWFIMTIIPESDFLEKIYYNNRRTFGIITLFLLSGIIIALFVAKRISKPLLRLNLLTKALSEGKWMAKKEKSGINEVDELETKFLLMSNRLKTTINNLNIEIKERKEKDKKLKKAKKEAEKANDAKSEFLANMSHELRTPMNSIIGYSDLMLSSEKDKNKIKYLSVIKRAGKRLMILINDILDFSKIEADQLELNISKINLKEFSQDILEYFKVQIENKNLELIFEFDQNLPEYILTDLERLRQVLVNLIGNAVKFTENGHVILKIELVKKDNTAKKAEIKFVVEDTGIGIPKEKQDLIFEAFRQVDGSTTRKYGGTGLGLSISDKILKKMDSKIIVESYENSNTKFYFILNVNLE
ncbi:MAG: sensor histidine kinase [Candidatus Muiribacteriota bacterium]